MRRLLLSACLAFSACWASAQQTFGNEWINYGQRYWSFWVGTYANNGDPQDALWHIDSTTLANAGFPVSITDARSIQIFGREHQIPLYFPGDSDGVFNGTDFIEFYVPKNDAWLDTALWDDPAHINNPYFSLIGDSLQYFITAGDPLQSKRIIDGGSGAWQLLPQAERWYWAESIYYQPQNYRRGERHVVGATTSYTSNGEGYFFLEYVNDGIGDNGDDGPWTIQMPITWAYQGAGAQPMKLTAVFAGTNSASSLSYNDHHVHLSAGTGGFQQNWDSSWVAEKTIKHTLEIQPYGYAQPTLAVQYSIVHDLSWPGSTPDYPDRQALAYLRAEYPHEIDDGTFEAMVLNMRFPDAPEDVLMHFYTGFEPVFYVLGDTIRRMVSEVGQGGFRNVRFPRYPGIPTQVIMVNPSAIRTVENVLQVNGDGYFHDYGALNVDSAMVIITHPKLMNGALQYAQYRETNPYNRYNTLVADVEELYQQFGGGIRRHPVAIRRFMANLLARFDTKPQALFLIGKATPAAQLGGDDLRGYRKNAIARDMCLVPSFGYPPSDALLTMGLSGNVWDQTVPVGRIAAQTDQQVLDYLAKVEELEVQQATPAAWMKNILHFRGGFTESERILFQNALDGYKMIAQDTCFTGHVYNFVKNPDELISQASADSVYDLVNEGVTLMTFFAHASGGGFDISIDQPNNYQWNGRYPFMIGNSCYTGNIHLVSSVSGSEQFVMPAGAGAIAFLASTDLGVTYPLYFMTENFYRSFSTANYGRSIGRHIQYLDSAVLNSLSQDILLNADVQQFTLHGDPTLIMNSPREPDLEITDQDLRLYPDPVTADVDSFQLKAVVRNNGNTCGCGAFPVAAVRSIDQGPTIDAVVQDLDLSLWQDTVTFTLPVLADSGGVGLNRIDVSVDLEDGVPGHIAESEDVINNKASIDFLLTSGDLLPADPYNFAITLDPAPLLQASTGNPLAPVRNYVFQIDTIDTYDSPMMEEGHVTAPGGVVSWQPPNIYALNQQQDSLVYFWRCTVDSLGNDGYDWHEFSFQYIPGRKGWGQANHMQFKDTTTNNSFENLIHDRPGYDFDYYTGARNIGAVVQGHSTAISKWTKDLVTQEGSNFFSSPCLNLGVIDPFDFVPWTTWWQGTGHRLGAKNDEPWSLYNGYGFNYRPMKAFIFRQDQPAYMDSLAWALGSDSIPDGHYIVLYSYMNLYQDLVLDSNPALAGALADLGATNLTTGVVPDDRPYIFICRKGFPNTAVEVWGQTATDLIDTAIFVNVTGNSGTMQAPRSAEMLAWNSLHWEIDPTVPTDSASITINTVNIPETTEQFAYKIDPSATTDSLLFDTIGIQGALFPRIRLSGAYNSELTGTPRPAQTKRWQIVGSPAPECAIDPPLGYFVSVDSLFEGQMARVMVAVHNISDVPMDSLLIAAWVTDQNNEDTLVHYKFNEPLPVNGVVLDTITFDLAGFAGNNSLVIEANPHNAVTGLYDQREQYHFNNIATLRFETLRDRENPILDVTFDGMHILDGDVVSARPEIKLTLDDENMSLLFDDITDTAQLKVVLMDPASDSLHRIYFHNGFGDEIMQFIPTTGPENVCRVIWNPAFLADGIYTLIVQASDISRNASGDHDYTVRFEVINKPTITEVLNYPNPFTTSTRFVFTLTGSEVPTGMRIRIMTITGRVVREIMLDELGALHVGRNITDYAWDGRDEFGDKLARGVYLYQVVAQLHGEDIEYRETKAGGYFTKGFGKMYLLR